MKQKFIIDNVPMAIDLISMHIENFVVDVTCLEDKWHQYISSGISVLELVGITDNGERIANTFQLVKKQEDAFVLKSIV
jgi:hypothetical protein